MDERTMDGKVVNPATGSSFHLNNFNSLTKELRERTPAEKRAEAQHSLGILAQLNQLDIHLLQQGRISDVDFIKEAYSNKLKQQIPVAFVNLALLGASYSNGFQLAGVFIGSALVDGTKDLILNSLKEVSADAMRAKEQNRLNVITDFQNTGLSEGQMRHLHFETVFRSISDGLYSDDPDVELVALTELAKAYMSGNGDLLPGLYSDTSFIPANDGQVNPKYSNRIPENEPNGFYRVEALLDACKRSFGEQARNGVPMSPKQQQTFSMVRGSIDICLLNNKNHPKVKDFIDTTYLSALDEIQNGAGKDFASRRDAIKQCETMFNSNVPLSRKQRVINKVLETFGILHTEKEPEPIVFHDPTKMSEGTPEKADKSRPGLNNQLSKPYDPEKTDAEQGIVMGEIVEDDGLQGPGAGTDVLGQNDIEPNDFGSIGDVDIPSIETTTPPAQPRGLDF